MKNNLLITFGCSWVFGRGVGYVENMSKEEYLKLADEKKLADKFSFRGLLSDKFNLTNINFAENASSNQRQFRLAKNFFISDEFKILKETHDNVIVIWGITSTARNEIYSVKHGRMYNFKYLHDNEKFSKIIHSICYDNAHEVEQLSIDMTFWNDYFNLKNIKNIWFDTFIHNHYPINVENMLFYDHAPRDILSKITDTTTINDFPFDKGHLARSTAEVGITQGMLNPHSFHPTKDGHVKISNMLSPFIKQMIE